jgi:hypothetical protein
LSRRDGYHDTYAKCHKDWFRHSKVDRKGFTTDSMEIA